MPALVAGIHVFMLGNLLGNSTRRMARIKPAMTDDVPMSRRQWKKRADQLDFDLRRTTFVNG
jgi:hypothetical protein